MLNSFMKIVPALTLGLGVGLQAQNVTTQKTAPACGINEGPCSCFARGCSRTLGGAVEVDFLYWRAENPGFSFVLESTGPEGNEVQKVVRFSSHWDPGFRVGLGLNTDFDRWDVFADWTWYQNKSTKSHKASDPKNGYLYGQWEALHNSKEDPGHEMKEVCASWRLQHNMFDLELGRAFYITKALSLRPHWGARGGWLDQKFDMNFRLPVNNPEALVVSPETYSLKAKNNYWGVGPRTGIHGQFHIDNSSWSVLGKASAALLLGKTRASIIDHDIYEPDHTPPMELEKISDELTQLVPNIQIFLGFDWGSCFDCENYYFGINAGWEASIYWNQCNVPISEGLLPSISSQAVTMEGLTVNMHLDF